MGSRKILEALLRNPDILLVPGCFDALSARLMDRAGFSAAFMGGFPEYRKAEKGYAKHRLS